MPRKGDGAGSTGCAPCRVGTRSPQVGTNGTDIPRADGHADGMTPIDIKRRAEARMLQLLTDSGLPMPDEVRYREDSVEFLWTDRKVAVIVDLDDFEENDAMDGYSRDGIAA